MKNLLVTDRIERTPRRGVRNGPAAHEDQTPSTQQWGAINP
ncbi:hypothetical protein [uncultured Agrobacterium sp.]|nr:hypothetical protein [uncultured Agrobacterium sp.]